MAPPDQDPADARDRDGLDAIPADPLDDMARLAAQVAAAPMAILRLVGDGGPDRSAHVGLDAWQADRCVAYRGPGLEPRDLLVVADTRDDPRFADHPLVAGGPEVRFYAGAALVARCGEALGILEVFDVVPRTLEAGQAEALRGLARQFVTQHELRRAAISLGGAVAAASRTEEALRAAESRKATILETALDAIITMDHRGIILEFNAAAEQTFGYSRDEAVGRTLADLIIPPALREAHRRGLDRYLATGEGPVLGRRIEIDAIRRGGGTFPAELAITSSHQGVAPTFTAHLRDITDRRRAEQELRHSEAEARKLALVASRTDNAVIVTDARGRIEWVNDGFTRITGYSPEEAAGRTPGSFLQGPDTDPATVAHMRHHLRRGEGFRAEVVNYSKAGRRYWLSIEVKPIHDEHGQLARFMAIESDITDRKRAEDELRRLSEEALRASRERLRTVVNAAPVVLFALDRDGTFTLSEGSGLAALGLNPAELVGQSVFDAYRDYPQILDNVRRALAGESFTAISEVDGLVFDTRFTSLRVDGRPSGVIGVANDVTESRRADEARRRAEAKYRDIFENALDGIFQTTPEGRYLNANPALARIYGFDSPEDLLVGITDIRSELYVEANRRDEFLRLMNEDDLVDGFESMIRRRDGQRIWISENARAVRDDHGTLLYFEGSVKDITERKRSESEIRALNAQLERRVGQMATLHEIDTAIAGSLDLPAKLDLILERLGLELGADAAGVLLSDPATGRLRTAASRGLHPPNSSGPRRRPTPGLAERAAREGRLIHIDDLDREPAAAGLPADPRFVSYYAVPLVAKEQVKGVLEVFHRGPVTLGQEGLDFLLAVAGQAALAIDNAALFADLQRTNAELVQSYDATIEGWSRALDLRDKETEGHTRRVTDMSLRLAHAMGFRGDELLAVRWGALLHDIGKMGIPDAILLKPGPLTGEEQAIMRQHPGYAHEWLSPIPFLRKALEIPYGHHEKWDGTGYPQGLKGLEIPLAARIFAAIDIWDALRSDRPYRKAWTEARVREHLLSLSGTHLDPEIVEVFLRTLEEWSRPPGDTGTSTDGPPRSSSDGRPHRPTPRTRMLLASLPATDPN